MENQKIKQFVEEVVREEIRKGDLIKSKDVLWMLPELIDTVHINKKKMRSSIEKCLSSTNPINALLNLFGVQLIKKERTISSLINSGVEYDDVAVKIDDSYAKQWLTLNPGDFKAVVEKIAAKLYELETQANQSYDEEKSRGDELFRKYEKLTREYSELKYSAEATERLVVERIQYILSLNGKEAVSENEQLLELLKDVNVNVYWESSDAPMTDAAMFTEYAVEEETMEGIKPCLVRNDSVYVKGIRFVKK